MYVRTHTYCRMVLTVMCALVRRITLDQHVTVQHISVSSAHVRMVVHVRYGEIYMLIMTAVCIVNTTHTHVQVTDTGFRCRCTGDYRGTLCGTPITSCNSNPCKNGGSCTVS